MFKVINVENSLIGLIMSDKLYISFYVKGETEDSSDDVWLSMKSVLEDNCIFQSMLKV